mmetsp:Transcript_126792/g.394653  ORF Transcript_126792/g.394653 Transcript_126792/m.394653 type:complete len:300 (+) Transcript_126792:63-962(+)
MPPASATATAASLSLAATRGAHATTRLDSFLRNTDASYQPAEAPTQGDRFIRKMATYGSVRPSVSFTSEPRVTRPHKEHAAVDMSRLPPPWLDPRGEPKEGTLEISPPSYDVDDTFVKLQRNQSLMLPSERYKEHLLMKESKKQHDADREAIFRHRKKINVMERHYPNGVLGMDGPLHPGTTIYAERREHLLGRAQERAEKAEARHDNLAGNTRSDDAVAFRNFGSDPQLPRSHDIGVQRKCVDSKVHPHRFLDTHDRLFPKHVATWDPERAAAIRSHQVRDRQHNIISGADNSVSLQV